MSIAALPDRRTIAGVGRRVSNPRSISSWRPSEFMPVRQLCHVLVSKQVIFRFPSYDYNAIFIIFARLPAKK
jgi:hypothetical protein